MKLKFGLLGIIALALTNCAFYPGELYIDASLDPFWVDHEIQGDCFNCSSTLIIQLSWDTQHLYSGPVCDDIDLQLLTPFGDLVTADSGEIGGCFHTGNDFGFDSFGYEEIVCDYPDYGDYRVRVINHSNNDLSGSLSIDYNRGGSTRNFTIFGNENRSFGFELL